MTVAPELPPVPAGGGDDRTGPVRRRSDGRPVRAARPAAVAVDRTPAGVVAVVEPPPARRGAPVRRSGQVPTGWVRPPRPVGAHPAAEVRAAVPPVGRVPSGRPAGPVGSTAPARRDLAGEPAGRFRAPRSAGQQVRVVQRVRVGPVRRGPLLSVVSEPVAGRLTELPAGPGAGAGRVHRPAGPVRLRPVGARVVRPARPGVRLTPRGQLASAVVVLAIAIVTLVGVAGRVGSLDGSAPLPASAPSQVVVAPGETLWSIAERVAPQRDPRTVVAQIRRLNGMPSVDVRAGQILLLRVP